MDIYKGFAHLTVILLASALGFSDHAPPFFISEPNSEAVAEGQNVTLACEAGPGGSVDVRWMYNDTEINPQSWRGISTTGSTLHISSFVFASESEERSASHTGIYRCIARNKVGAVISRPAVLSSKQLESCHQELVHESMSVTAGNTVVLPCRGIEKHVSSLDIEFELSGVVLKLSSRHKILPSHSLQIENITSSDSGIYRCICPSSFPPHRIVASVVHLKVEAVSKDVPSEFTWTSPRHLQVVEGQTLTLECAAAGWPVPLITWLRYGGILPTNRHSQHLGILHVREVRKVDEGTYICRAENTAGPPQIHVVFVDVLQPPKILLAPTDLTTTEGARVTLNCRSEGSPRPSVTWYHDAVPMVNSNSSKINADGALVLMDVQENQSGMYQCIVSNMVNSTSASARLTVRPALPTGGHRRHNPADKKGHRSLTLPPRRTTIATPTPPLDFPDGEMGTYSQDPDSTRSADESPESRETKSLLMLSDSERRPGQKKPKGPRTYPKHPKHPPRKTVQKNMGVNLIPPSKPTVSLVSDTSAQLRWSIGQNEGLNVTLFKVQFKEIKNRKHRKSAGWHTIDEDIAPDVSEFTVSDLKPGITYQFRLVAIYSNNDNKHGPNSDQLLMSVTGQRTKVSLTTPIIVAVHPLSVSEISISWQFMPAKREVVNGFMIHYKPYETDHGYKQYVVHGRDERQVILSSLLQDTTYSLRMQSFNSEGFSDYSNTAVKKTNGPSDNITDNYPLDSYTPLFPPPADNLPPFGKDRGDIDIPRNMGTTLRSGIESQVPLSRTTYPHQNTDLLFVVLGGVLGAVVIVVIFIIVFCFWRQRQQQLLIAALQARAKANNIHPPHLLANGFAAADYQQETVNIADPGARKKRTQNKRDHIPGCVGGCPKGTVGGCPKGVAGGCQPTSQYCRRYQPTHDEWNSQQFPLVAQSLEKRPTMREVYACANTNYGSPSDVDTSDGDSVASSCPAQWTPAADCAAEMYNSEMLPQPLLHPQPPPHPLVTSFRPVHRLASKNCQQMMKNSCDCDQFSCQLPSTEPSSDALQKLADGRSEGNNSQSGQSDSLPRSCSSDCSSSSSSSASICNRRCHLRQQSNRETNDSGVYDEASDCKHHSTANCGTGDQCQVLHN